METEIKNNTASQQFETTVNDKTAFITYNLRPGILTVLHTEVPKALKGQGIASALSKFALDYIAAEKLQLVPLCPYMQAFLKKHPEYAYLVKN